ncbi:tRNA pseudouridine synthase 3 [Nadsonia fulvescens var. elongata DSM 6958]|uniref:tRNA pseudouridine synthase 3 n=1 Tax=Nadsonia fulvescens var. elongata DSM 6958 TaxID=857566 RepID=A0A1E3PHL7_9ASCO|nr:tRNA pseudouridine synthase 3 [Nadsonia fulvescens var. elongata DSM 6958]
MFFVKNSVLSCPLHYRYSQIFSKSLYSTMPTNYHSWNRESLIKRIVELERYNPATAATVKHKPPQQPKKKKKAFDWSKFSQRKIALRFSYLGWDYNGLAYQHTATPLPTVEGEILSILAKTRLIEDEDLDKCEFSRCGRTDRGVSALAQVISIMVRSNLTSEQQLDSAFDADELDYVNILNYNLPPSIRVYEVCLRPPSGFDARFSCQYRHYRYYFPRQGLDIEAMREAASYYVGPGDYRNFCKIDGSKQIVTYERTVYNADIISLKNGSTPINLKGSAFLWHQVRCMMAILFLVGQGYEKPSIVKDLLDHSKYPSRPLYIMASEFPLVLYDCVYPDDVQWASVKTPVGVGKLQDSIFNTWYELSIKAQMAKTMRDVIFKSMKSLAIPPSIDYKGPPIGEALQEGVRIDTGYGRGNTIAVYEKLEDRPVMESVAEQNKKWRVKNSKESSLSE